MSRIIFVNRYFYPDHSATSQILTDLAFALGESGRSVSVVTTQQRYDDPRAHLPRQEKTRSVDIHRVLTTQFGRSALWGRGMDYLSFYRGAYQALRRLTQPGDILVAKTDPPLISLVAMQVARSHSAHLVNWLQDLYPEVAVELGVPFLKGPVIGAISSLRDRSLKAAAANVVLEQRMAERVLDRGVAADKVHVIPNWSDDERIVPVARHDNFLRRAWGLNDEFVVGYSGNLGRAHEFMTVLTASERLRDHPTIRFLMIGGGHQFDELVRGTKARGLAHLWQFKPYQDHDALKLSLGVPDIHWISLKPALEGLIVPSKFYGIAAAGRPVIAITAPDGDIARLVRQHGCGIVITPGDATALTDALTSLAASPVRTDEMGRRARAMLNALFTRQHACTRWSDLLDQIGAGIRPLQPANSFRSDINAPSIASR
jgi:colanic acid biosynthesis glycosyl transferase WcaI